MGISSIDYDKIIEDIIETIESGSGITLTELQETFLIGAVSVVLSSGNT